MRGKADGTVVLGAAVGITPAYAGKSISCAVGVCVVGDHPRVCGEKPAWLSTLRRYWGSPPRMRGKETGVEAVSHCLRITPAYAGKSSFRAFDIAPDRDHPRVCGEKENCHRECRGPRGSPPRMRGKVVVYGLLAVVVGITPAYAGKSERISRPTTCQRDHPRVCGEKEEIQHFIHNLIGSPPRMRGKAVAAVPVTAVAGITPAYAGKRAVFRGVHQMIKDHPRVCGEKFNLIQQIPGAAGITPAYAGKSHCCGTVAAPDRDHPRVCGEKLYSLI